MAHIKAKTGKNAIDQLHFIEMNFNNSTGKGFKRGGF